MMKSSLVAAIIVVAVTVVAIIVTFAVETPSFDFRFAIKNSLEMHTLKLFQLIHTKITPS